jgi:hypothetical protein
MERKRCPVCNDFDRKYLTTWINMHQYRFAFDCAPAELLAACAVCYWCRLIFNGIRQFRGEIGDFTTSVSRLYTRGPADTPPHTLSLEIYFHDSRPKLELELFTHNMDGTSERVFIIKQYLHIHKVLLPPKERYDTPSRSFVRVIQWARKV